MTFRPRILPPARRSTRLSAFPETFENSKDSEASLRFVFSLDLLRQSAFHHELHDIAQPSRYPQRAARRLWDDVDTTKVSAASRMLRYVGAVHDPRLPPAFAVYEPVVQCRQSGARSGQSFVAA